jgi:hypothetical protein
MKTELSFQVHFARTSRGGNEIRIGTPPPKPPEVGQVQRLSKLMALAIHFQELLESGRVESMAVLARAGQVTRARLTQVMDLTMLAPDIQEEILMLPRVRGERSSVPERRIRVIAAEPDWMRQRELWKGCRDSGGGRG